MMVTPFSEMSSVHFVRPSRLAKVSRNTSLVIIRYLVCPPCEQGERPPSEQRQNARQMPGCCNLEGPVEQAPRGNASGLGHESPDPKMLCTGSHIDEEILADHSSPR